MHVQGTMSNRFLNSFLKLLQRGYLMQHRALYKDVKPVAREGANTHLVCNRLLRTVKTERDGSFNRGLQQPVTAPDKEDM
jgi:hypothetical protein